MIEIKEVKSKSEIKKFVDFPTKLYKSCEQYVHPLRMSEMEMFDVKKNASADDCDFICFLAYKDKKIVGRIAGIIHNLYNKKTGENRVRFTRFDSIDDIEVARALFNAVETWARDKGMNIIHGPIGFNDLDREGLIVKGFEYTPTFEEGYNFEYYINLIEKCGFKKETAWLELRVFTPEKMSERLTKLNDMVLKRYNLHLADKSIGKSKFIKKYKKDIFRVIDEAYSPLYGVVPYTQKVFDQVIGQFNLLLTLDFIVVVLDENERVVGFGLGLPSLAEASKACKGKLFPFGVFKFLGCAKKKKMDVLNFALVAVSPEYQNKGVDAIILHYTMSTMMEKEAKYCETNVILEDNSKSLAQWKLFKHENHRTRNAYIKTID